MFIERIKNNYKFNEPISTKDILKLFPEYSRAYTFRLIKKGEKTEELHRFSNGIYFLFEKTIWGNSVINAEIVAEKKYIKYYDNIYGIYSGIKLLNMFSVTTQVPNVIEIVTNNEGMRCRKVNIDGRKFILRKSRTEINKNNSYAYMVLQLFSDIQSLSDIDDNVKLRLVNYIKERKITKQQLISLAMFFPAKTMKNLMGSGILNDAA